MRSERTNTALSLHVSVSRLGPITGATVRVSLKRNDVANSWLDFGGDLTFKTSGWTDRYQTLTEAGDIAGFYEYLLDLTSITLPAAVESVIPFFEVTAPAADAGGIAGDEIFFDDKVEDTSTPAVIAGAVWDEILTGGTHNISTSAGKRVRQQGEAFVANEGIVVDASASTSSFDTDLTQVDDFWEDTILVFIDGALTGQARTIAVYANASGNVTFDEPLTSAPANGVSFLLLATHVHPVNEIAGAIWDKATASHTTSGSFGALLNDNLDATVSSVNDSIAALNDLDGADVQAAMTAQGYTTARAALIDNLDAAVSSLSTENLQTQLYFANANIDGTRKVPASAVSHAAVFIRPDGGSFSGSPSWYVWFNYGSTAITAAGSGSSKPFAVAPTDDGGAGFSVVVIPS